MLDFMNHLMAGDEDTIQFVRNAGAFWAKFHEEYRSASVEEIAEALSKSQWSFERCYPSGNRGLAKSMMGYMAMAPLYGRFGFDDETGFGGNRRYALRLVNAFAKSSVSSECKSSARKAAKMYALNEEPVV